MIKIGEGVVISPRHIESLERGYVRGAFAVLHIRMASGRDHVIERRDVERIEQEIRKAIEESERAPRFPGTTKPQNLAALPASNPEA